ncbi:hypothetical protein SNEBB_007951 [Seison nebaliae]|nr:hypothetical protein SNEBB_007951 [Seison nebaliae]
MEQNECKTLSDLAADIKSMERNMNFNYRSVIPFINQKHNDEMYCRKVSMKIDFTQFNLDNWIISPLTYEAFQCIGSCELQSKWDGSNNGMLKQLEQEVFRNKSGSCCIPTAFESLNILHRFTNTTFDGIVFERFDNMIVSKCACR